jgi:DNA-binding transcriptional ArsR family regulator
MSTSEKDDLVFKALADSRRRVILDLLSEGGKTTGEICSAFPSIDRCTVMMHLRVLERAGLIVTRREGKFCWNYIDCVPIRRIYDRWINKYASPSVEFLERLHSGLEKLPAKKRSSRIRPTGQK